MQGRGLSSRARGEPSCAWGSCSHAPRRAGGLEPLERALGLRGPPLYNRMTGNLGYHTAHHSEHGLHWSKLPVLHTELAREIPATCSTAGRTSQDRLGVRPAGGGAEGEVATWEQPRRRHDPLAGRRRDRAARRFLVRDRRVLLEPRGHPSDLGRGWRVRDRGTHSRTAGRAHRRPDPLRCHRCGHDPVRLLRLRRRSQRAVRAWPPPPGPRTTTARPGSLYSRPPWPKISRTRRAPPAS